MPDFLIAHQTPTLLIKMKYPKKFDGVALCIGAMAPDFNGFIAWLNNESGAVAFFNHPGSKNSSGYEFNRFSTTQSKDKERCGCVRFGGCYALCFFNIRT